MHIRIISYFNIVVNFKDDGGFTTFLDKFKTTLPEIDEGTTKIFEKVGKIQTSQLPNVNWDKWCARNNVANDSLKSFLKTWDGTGDVAEQYQQYLTRATSSTAKFTNALKNIGANMAISAAISLAMSAVSGLIKASDEIAQKTKEVGDSFVSTKSEISDYKTQVESLYETINNSSSSYAEVTDARKQLLSIQSEMIEQYGTEQASIEAITDAINGEADAWEKLVAEK